MTDWLAPGAQWQPFHRLSAFRLVCRVAMKSPGQLSSARAGRATSRQQHLLLDTQRIIKNSVQLSNRLIQGIECDLREVHELIHGNDQDNECNAQLVLALRHENIDLRVRLFMFYMRSMYFCDE